MASNLSKLAHIFLRSPGANEFDHMSVSYSELLQ